MPEDTGSERTHCKRGHPLSGPNLVLKRRRDKRPERLCRLCKNAGNRAARARRVAVGHACIVEGCLKPAETRGMCPMHYQRQRITGAAGTAGMIRLPQRGVCSVAGCTNPKRKTGWCAAHYSQHTRLGYVAPFARQWASPGPCLVCGGDTAASELRRFCSNACYQLRRIHGGRVPAQRACVACGSSIELRLQDADGRDRSGRRHVRIRSDVKLCRRCRQDKRKHGVSVVWLATRDGATCGICSGPVDMTLVAPDAMRPSVDHIIPRARGGTNDPDNLQLAHLQCNRVKSDRVPLAVGSH